jgi:Mismatch repair ATPase (MutS family)
MAKTKTEDTPLMQQHKAIKQKYPDAILLFRVGDFYETLGRMRWLLHRFRHYTNKKKQWRCRSSDLAGFPHHALDTYLHKLVKAGYRLLSAINWKILSLQKGSLKEGDWNGDPGTTVNDKLLEHHSNNFLAGIHFAENDQYGLAFLDISTGEFFIAEGDREYADKLLQGFKPAEVVFQRHQQKKFKEFFGAKIYSYTLMNGYFQKRMQKKHY